MATRRTHPVVLAKSCPYCSGTSYAEARLPIPASVALVAFDLDDLGTLVERQSLSMLLALVELLPYKNFVCRHCRSEFRLESQSAKDLVQAMLASMQPVLPPRPAHALAHPPPHVRPRTELPSVPRPTTPAAPAREEWEAESLDALLGAGDPESTRP